MKLSENLPMVLVLGFLVIGGGAMLYSKLGGGRDTVQVAVKLPTLTPTAQQGKSLFDENCAACHGWNAAGSDKGPPLVHKIYEPNHHGDQSFILAAKTGVRAHHWRFGNMPPVAGITNQQVGLIVTYVRALQRANGIN